MNILTSSKLLANDWWFWQIGFAVKSYLSGLNEKPIRSLYRGSNLTLYKDCIVETLDLPFETFALNTWIYADLSKSSHL